jgi:hypothetical protein
MKKINDSFLFNWWLIEISPWETIIEKIIIQSMNHFVETNKMVTIAKIIIFNIDNKVERFVDINKTIPIITKISQRKILINK